ncbi:hypothetical protein [Polluticaenibacter yanchengensis]|uniref:Uncharacterized protein n=1 Tax=Polluticaenibacter yanchengensis TaxID=3014562 RepID=A0ABT4UJ98_9BACT|nr:hypothetical protein [Chitinophagaceae bacterium LY-5]
MSEFKGTPGPWIVTQIGEPLPKVDNSGHHCVGQLKSGRGLISVWFSDVHSAKTKEEALYNAQLVSKSPEMLEMLQSVEKLQSENYGNGSMTHMLLKAKAEEIRKLITEATTI